MDGAEIFTEASPNALTPSKLRATWSDSDSKFDDFDQSVDDFQNFFGQMDTECDVDRIQTVLNDFRILDRQNHLLTILKVFSARWTPNAMLTTYKQLAHCAIPRSTESIARTICWRFWLFFFAQMNACWPCRNSLEQCTISGYTESAIESVPNRRSEQSTGRGFNLSALYALILLV